MVSFLALPAGCAEVPLGVMALPDLANIVVNPATDLAVPQVVDGDNWKTSFFLTSLEAVKTVYWSLNFIGDGGLPMNLAVERAGPASRVFAALPPGWSITIDTQGTAATLTQGWALLTTLDRPPDQSGARQVTDRIGGMAVFRQRVAGRPDFEAVVPFSPLTETTFVMPFDNRSGFSTGIALLNPHLSAASNVGVLIQMPNSDVLRRDVFLLQAGSKLVFSMPDRYTEAANREGRLTVTTTGPFLSGLGLRFNPTGAFTSFHALSVQP